MAATAITKAIEDVTSVKVGIKWPNDVLYEGKKFSRYFDRNEC